MHLKLYMALDAILIFQCGPSRCLRLATQFKERIPVFKKLNSMFFVLSVSFVGEEDSGKVGFGIHCFFFFYIKVFGF